MSDTESARIELYEIAKTIGGSRFAELLMTQVPRDPDRLATKDDVALLGSELRRELAAAEGRLSSTVHGATSGQTRTLVLGLVGSVVALVAANIVALAVMA